MRKQGREAGRPQEASEQGVRHLPGEEGIWVFILGDLMIFSCFFIVYTWYRSLDPELFLSSQLHLNQNYGAINTLFLLASSWFVVLAVQSARDGDGKIAPRCFVLALLCGLGFSLVKLLEYGEKIQAGITLTTNDFYMYYYIFTGIHFLHVIIGMGVLLFLWRKAQVGFRPGNDIIFLESGASYWHMVDLLWIVLFPLLYLMR